MSVNSLMCTEKATNWELEQITEIMAKGLHANHLYQ